MERVLILAGLAALVLAFLVSGRLLARRRRRQLRYLSTDVLWDALGSGPNGRPSVVAFSTPGCAACWTAQKPALAALEDRAPGRVRVIEIDAAEQPEVARVFGVLTVPATVVLGESGAVLAANQGFATTDALAAQLGLD
jgi:thiol-disulfide isomerase/thioredoxin